MNNLIETGPIHVDGLDGADGAAGVPQVINRVESRGDDIREDSTNMGQPISTASIVLEGLDCADCAAKLEKRIQLIPGVQKARVNFAAGSLSLEHQDALEAVMSVLGSMGYRGILDSAGPSPSQPFWQSNRYMQATMVAGSLLLLAMVFQAAHTHPLIWRSFYILAVLLGGYPPARAGLSLLIKARELDMNVLMMVAAIGALGLGQYQEGAVVVFLFALGNAIQGYTFDRTRNSIRSLMELAPAEALVRRADEELVLPVDDIRMGEIVIIRPGERIPMDGEVRQGSSFVNQAAITGESVPVEKRPGDRVFAGTINEQGAMEIEVTTLARDNTVARIIHLVEEAEGEKAPAELLVDRFARYYTPAVMGAALLAAILPPLLLHQPWHKWFYEALGMLLVSCPCALVISTPVAIVAAIGSAARKGVLIKGGVYLEKAGELTAIAFDKTGTLTRGKPELSAIIPVGAGDKTECLTIAAAMESRSEHPLGRAIVRYSQEKGIKLPVVSDFEAIAGKGVRARVGERVYLLGSPSFMQENNILMDGAEVILKPAQESAETVVLLADTGRMLAVFMVGDTIRENAAGAINRLHQAGIINTIMLTGDNKAAAQAIAAQTGVDEFKAELLPADKVAAVRDLLDRYEAVGMVGDGVNDAPALARATVGIAMGVAGADAALETADIALMGDDLSLLAYVIRLSRRARRIIKENIAFSLVFKAAILLLVIPGWLTLWLAVVGDMGTTLLVTLNGLRLMRIKA